ncbi:hypothetical protein ACFQW6_00765 [Nocardioides sp. GCM10028917]|uniref:hypothetical protein n=1 Tax=Nocardioides sp. GCM10028917 TaxID=3273408 RepID=UPI00360FF75F
MEPSVAQSLLTNLALSVHDAADAGSDVRAVRDELKRALPDVDPDLVEDLLIFAFAHLVGVDVNLGAVDRTWGAAAAREAALRLTEIADELSNGS